MQNVIFIKTHSYNESLVGEQLLPMLEKSVLVDYRWCNYSQSEINSDLARTVALDNLSYMINNFLFAKAYDYIICPYSDLADDNINALIDHIRFIDNVRFTNFDLSDTSLRNVDNFELINKEYDSRYINTKKGQLVRYSYVDTTDISAFKIAKTLEEIIKK